MACSDEYWIVGPSARGSEKGKPSSMMSDAYSYKAAFIATMAVAALALVLSLFMPETRTQDEENLTSKR